MGTGTKHLLGFPRAQPISVTAGVEGTKEASAPRETYICNVYGSGAVY